MNIVDAIAEFENIFAMILEKTLQSDRRWPPFWSRDKYLDEILFQAYIKELILKRLPERPGATTSINDILFDNGDFRNNDEARCRT